MGNRDNFSAATKTAVAARASWRCSFTGCPKLTIGPSDEAPDALIKTGEAAHICGAAPGPGSRRYDPSMTSAQRKHIDNAIWLCADHAKLIDRDEATYTAAELRAMKLDHEKTCAIEQRSGTKVDMGTDLFAIGPDLACTGELVQVAPTSWTLRLKHFVIGDFHHLVSYVDGFGRAGSEDRYLTSNELGDGRVLAGAPTLTKIDGGYDLICPVGPGCLRIDAQRLGSEWAMHPETADMYVRDGKIARVSGLEALPQRVRSLLSLQQGESVFNPTAGARFFEYFNDYAGSPWLSRFLKMDVVRLTSIPNTSAASKGPHPSLPCVTRVLGVELLSDVPTANRLPVRVEFEVQGVGNWQREISVFMPTPEQMEKIERRLTQRTSMFNGQRPA
jgi:hypothetical protein